MNNRTLIVVDMQRGFITDDNYRDLNKRLDEYIKNSNYETIIFTKFKNNYTKNPLYQDKIGWYELTDADSQEFSLDAPKGAIIMEKFGYGLELGDLKRIKDLNEGSVDICGLKANACVYAISLQMFDMGIHPNILFNYVECNPVLKDAMKKIYISQFGSIDERK